MENQHESDLVKRTRATWNRSRRVAHRNHPHLRADLHQWPPLEEALVTFLGEALSRYEALRKRSGLTPLEFQGRAHPAYPASSAP